MTFFVGKKDGRQRLVWDCPVANRCFKAGGEVRIASGAKWADLRVGRDDQLHVGQCDVKNYLYAVGLPEALGRFFCRPPFSRILTDPLRVTEIDRDWWFVSLCSFLQQCGIVPCNDSQT